MEVKVNKEYGFVQEEVFTKLHQKSRLEAIDLFNQRATIGSHEVVEEYRQMLLKAIDEAYEVYKEQNQSRDPLATISKYIVGLLLHSKLGTHSYYSDCLLLQSCSFYHLCSLVYSVQYY